MTTPTVRLRSTDDIAESVGHLLGYTPARSLVCLCLGAGRLAGVVMTLRVDLPPPGGEAALTAELVGPIRRCGAARVVMLVYDDDGAEEVDGPSGMHLVMTLGEALGEHDISVFEALHVAHGRWRSFLCRKACCAPGRGHPIPGAAAPSALGTALAVTLGTRVPLDITSAPREGLADALDAQERSGRRVTPRGTLRRARAAARALRAGVGPDLDAAVALIAGVQPTPGRDEILLGITREELDDAVRLWAQLLRECPDPWVPQVAAVCGHLAYRSGDGVTARDAMERALVVDPEHVLAALVLAAVRAGIPPSQMELSQVS